MNIGDIILGKEGKDGCRNRRGDRKSFLGYEEMEKWGRVGKLSVGDMGEW